LSAWAEGKSSKDMVDQRALMSSGQGGIYCQIFSTSRAILARKAEFN